MCKFVKHHSVSIHDFYLVSIVIYQKDRSGERVMNDKQKTCADITNQRSSTNNPQNTKHNLPNSEEQFTKQLHFGTLQRNAFQGVLVLIGVTQKVTVFILTFQPLLDGLLANKPNHQNRK